MDRFWQYVEKSKGCWEWTGGRTGSGYGAFGVSHGHMVSAHRFMWEQERGAIPEGLCVLHRCDNRGCVRPGHLYLGTHRDNAHDREVRARSQTGATHWTRRNSGALLRGSKHGRTHLSEQDVLRIRDRLAAGEAQTVIASDYGIGQVTVSEIKLRKTWTHI